MRQLQNGKVVVANGDELGVLDAPFDGVVQFDSSTGTAFIGSYAANSVQDQDVCSALTPAYGQLLLGADPGEHDLGIIPERRIAVTRLTNSNKGFMWGFLKSCPVNGSASEIAPVQITPADIPEDIPPDLKYLAFRLSEPSSDCSVRTLEWYGSNGVSIIADGDLALYSIPAEPLTVDDNEDFRFGIYVEQDGQWVLKSLDNASFQSFLKVQNSNSVVYLQPRATIFDQQSPSAFAEARVIDWTTQPNYFALAREVQLTVDLTLTTLGEVSNVTVNFDSVDKVRGTASNQGQREMFEITIPIPSSKNSTININKIIAVAGANYVFNASRVLIYLEAFR